MAGRILTLQRQARELGRLRAGVTETKMVNGREKTFPSRSKTWILTSHQREYLDAAAEQWGGTVERWQPQGSGAEAWRVITESEAIDAILPPGDPLSQYYEMWSKGGCQRRCDGETEQLSTKACLCLAKFGPEFHLEKPEDACRPHTRLNVILPDVPDLGVWRMESKGFYAANEIAASIDLIRNATGGNVMVPVRLRIEPRKRVAQGKTKQYPVIVVEIRGATAGQILSGAAPQAILAGTSARPAIEAAPDGKANGKTDTLTAEKVLEIAALCKTAAQVRQLWADAVAAEVLTDALKQTLTERATELGATAKPVSAPPATTAAPASAPAMEGEVEPDPEQTWAAIMAAVPATWSTSDLEGQVQGFLGKSSIDADGFELQRFLNAVKNGEVK